MPRVLLLDLAHARSGDKGDTANVGVLAYDPQDYPLLRNVLTPERVKAHFGALVKGEVERFELPHLSALNFLLHGALGGGGTVSLMTDAQGKVFSTALLRMEVEVSDAVADRVRGRGRMPVGPEGRAVAPASLGPLHVEIRDSVATLTLNRPDKRNALNRALVTALLDALRETGADPRVRVVVLQGAGADFCAGADLAELQDATKAGVEASLADADRLGELFLAIRAHPRPVVAAVRGRVLAGGCGLALACDLIFAQADARFGFPEIHLGFVPAMVLALLRRKMPEGQAFAWLVQGDVRSGEDLERQGLLQAVFPAETFQTEVDARVEALAARSPSAVALTKRLFYGLDGVSLTEAIARGGEINVLARMTDACRAGVQDFLERPSTSTPG
jgi:methylglutaconyl-CoA hydratase